MNLVQMGVLALALAAAPAQAERRALLIGINDYLANDEGQQATGSWIPQDLNGALNDIALMQSVLESRYGFSPENIQTLRNEEATRDVLLATLRRFVADTAPDDVVYIHFSGHGSQVEDRNGDEPDGLDESILPHDARTGQVPDITDDELGDIFASLATERAWIVLDSCHSGTATRGASQVLTRSVALDPRGELYTGEAGGASSPETQAPYVLMTGAAEYQSALDGPIDEGRHYGLFSLSMGRVLGQLSSGVTARDAHALVREEMARIGSQFGLYAIPEAQLEGLPTRLETPLLEGPALPAGTPIEDLGDGRVRLAGAGRLAAEPGALWAVTKSGADGASVSANTLVIESVDGDDAIARFDGRGQAPASQAIAVPLAPATPSATVPVRLDRVTDADRERLTQMAAGRPPLVLVPEGAFARFVVDREDDRWVVSSAGGLQRLADFPAGDASAAVNGLVRLAQRSVRLNELLTATNPGARLRLDVSVRAGNRPADTGESTQNGAAALPRFSVRSPNAPRQPDNSLVLSVSLSDDAYLTVVDIDAQGAVAQLFPNPVSDRNGFYPNGLVPGGTTIELPDDLGENRAGFHWDIVPPTGVETLRVFAARDLATAEALRALVRQVGGGRVRGNGASDLRLALFAPRPAAGMTTRGVATVAADTPNPRPDWTAATLSFHVEP